jgi:hypothetical protein
MKQMATLVSILISFSVFAQQAKLFEGKIGKYPVVLKLTENNSEKTVTVNYYYLNQRKDIELNGDVDGNGETNVLQMLYGYEEEEIPEKLLLKKNGNGYKGVWTKGKTSLPAILSPFTNKNPKSPYDQLDFIQDLRKGDLYNYLRISGFHFIKDSTSRNGACNLEWFREKNSGIVLPRIKDGYKPEIIKKINDFLLKMHLEEADNSLECTAARNGEYYVTVDHVYSHKNIFSVNVFTSYYCGGAHPDFGSTGYNFDTQTGKTLEMEDVFWFGKTYPPSENSSEWYEYRSNEFSGTMINIFKKLYPEHFDPDSMDADDNCDYNDSSAWDFTNWYFKKEGLYIGPIFYRAARSCDQPEWTVIPYKVAREFLNPKSNIKLPE